MFIVIRAGGHGGADGRANEVLEEVARRLAELDVLCARGEGFVSLEVDGVGIGGVAISVGVGIVVDIGIGVGIGVDIDIGIGADIGIGVGVG
ncbi:MAG: hypothetical protein IPM79_11720 [Polyangiaceae bacterium]|nr:hypothetical protein [Polyangiaceae bacterium]MBK8938281.1 hypothetical protein [Polyangiaceae bacterium]